VAKDEFPFRPLNFIQKFLNASEKILWPGELLFFQHRLHVSKNQKSEGAKSGLWRMEYPNDRIFSEKVLRGL
jgi:hypothetical protein